MTKADIVQAIKDKAGMETKAQAARRWVGQLSVSGDALAGGDSITLTGFGNFKVTERAARTGRNPQTGKAIKIPAVKVIKFSAGKKLRESVN